MPTIDVMPMTTPRTVRAERNLFVRTVSTASPKTSQTSARRSAMASLSPQRFDWIEPRRAHGGIQPEEQPDDGRNPDAQRDGPGFDRGGDRRERPRPPWGRAAPQRPG